MKISERVSNFQESVTLKLNAEVVKMQESGEDVINLTAGQLPFNQILNLLTASNKKLTS